MNLFWFVFHFFTTFCWSHVIIKVAMPPSPLQNIVQIIADSELVWFHCIFIMWWSYVYEHRKMELKIVVAPMIPSCMNLTVADDSHSCMARCTSSAYPLYFLQAILCFLSCLVIPLTMLTVNIICYEPSRKDTTK
jgi:hypothetical protein